MTDKPENPPAFPPYIDPWIDHPNHGRIHRAQIGETDTQGMTLRDYFAGRAMHAMISHANGEGEQPFDPTDLSHHAAVAMWAYNIADAMLEARQ